MILAVRPLLAVAVLLVTAPAFAAAVTYQGTLGKTAVVVELAGSSPVSFRFLNGRYAYLAKGIDIPLDAAKAAPGAIDLSEERPCTGDICHEPADGETAKPPLGAKWHLTANADGSVLTGVWQDAGKSLPIALQRAGTRALPADFDGSPAGLASIVDSFSSGELPLTETTSPYDFIKLHFPLTAGAVTRFGASSFHYATDPRTKFGFPRIDSLGGADPALANQYLERRHWQLSLGALSCAAQRYQGLGWTESSGAEADPLAGYEDERVEVSYLTPTVMSWTESGSIFCGGAHPDNHRDIYNLDARTGKPLDLSLLFEDWVATKFGDTAPADLAAARAKPDDYSWGPDPTLVDFVEAHRSKSGGAAPDDTCGTPELVASNLAIGFVRDDRVRFSLSALPNVIAACNDDLFDLPIAQLKSLLTPEAAAYFPSLQPK